MAFTLLMKSILAAVVLYAAGEHTASGFPTGSDSTWTLSPVVFIPGNGGSQLEARVDPPTSARSFGCPDRTGWFRLWLNIWDFVRGRMACWSELTRLYYDPETRSSRSPPGVHIRVPGFGDTDTVEYIDPTWLAWASGDIGRYAEPLIENIVRLGYRRGISIRAAPYDFRIAPHHQQTFMANLKTLVEETYQMNGQTKVTLIAHSMGGLFMTYFLKLQTAAWKNQYISSVVSINTPWMGTGVITKVFTSGFTFGVNSVDATLLQKVQTSQETAPYLFPRPGAWSDHDVILKTPYRNYTVRQRDQFFDDMGFPQAKLMYEDVSGADYDLEHPGVEFNCIYSHGLDTPFAYVYDEDPVFTQAHARIINSDGDGTVNIKSLQGCTIFSNLNSRQTTVTQIPGPDHGGIFTDQNFLKKIRSILKKDPETQN